MSNTVKVRGLWYINKKKILNRAIAAATWLPNMDTEPVSHCSEWEPDLSGDFRSVDYGGYFESIFCGLCWTSTTRKVKGDPNDIAGTKVRRASEVLDHPGNWLYTEHEVDIHKFGYAKAMAKWRVMQNKGYSYRDLSRFIMPLWLLKATKLADNGREICSEHVAQWLVDMGIFDKNTIPSPRRLCKQVVLATGSPLRRLVDDVVVRDKDWKKIKGM